MFPLVSLARSSSVHSKESSSIIASMRFGYLKQIRETCLQIFSLKFALTNLGNVFKTNGERFDTVVISSDANVVYASHPSDVVDVICGLNLSSCDNN